MDGKWSVHHPNMPCWSFNRVLWSRFMHCTMTFHPHHFFFFFLTWNTICDGFQLENKDITHAVLVSAEQAASSSSYLSLGLRWQFLSSLSLWNVKTKKLHRHSSCLSETTAVLLPLLCACFLWIGGNFNGSANRRGPSSRSVALGLWRDRLLLWLPVLRSASTRPINQTGSCDLWQSVGN